MNFEYYYKGRFITVQGANTGEALTNLRVETSATFAREAMLTRVWKG